MNIQEINITDLKPYADNPRINDDAVELVARSIQDFGFRNPVIIDSDNTIIVGHTRVKACEKLGIQMVPCIRVEDLTEDQINAFRLADNKTGEFAAWDFTKLDTELEEIGDLSEYGFSSVDEYFDDFLDDPEIEESKPTQTKEPKTITCPYCDEIMEI